MIENNMPSYDFIDKITAANIIKRGLDTRWQKIDVDPVSKINIIKYMCFCKENSIDLLTKSDDSLVFNYEIVDLNKIIIGKESYYIGQCALCDCVYFYETKNI